MSTINPDVTGSVYSQLHIQMVTISIIIIPICTAFFNITLGIPISKY